MLLKGVRVLDLSTLLPGPMCSLYLADFGADVIKIENLQGDFMRRFETVNKKSPYFSALNRNKKSITLNLKTGEGKKIFLKLAEKADVIIENFRPGKMESFGLSYREIKKINPRIVYCSITGYGQKGYYKNRAGHDLNYASVSGLLDVMSQKPFVLGVQVSDISSAILAAFAIVSCLLYRQKSGKGEHIDVSMLNSSLSLINMHIAYYSALKKRGTVLSGGKPCYNIYETKDGKYASLCAIEKKFWQSFCNCTKRMDLLQKQFDDESIKEVIKLFKSKTLKEWVKLNEEHDFCCEPVRNIRDVLNDNNLRKDIIDIEGVMQVASPIMLSTGKKLEYVRAPKLGEHNEQILSRLGYDRDSLKALRKKNVIIEE